LISKFIFIYNIFYFFCIQSFNDVKIWYKEIKSNSNPDIKIFLVGNKSDLENKREVSKESVQNIIKDLDIDLYFETSAKNGENVEKLFVEASKILYNEYSKINNSNKKRIHHNHSKNNNLVLRKSLVEKQEKNNCKC